jgi:hypothetical protein
MIAEPTPHLFTHLDLSGNFIDGERDRLFDSSLKPRVANLSGSADKRLLLTY